MLLDMSKISLRIEGTYTLEGRNLQSASLNLLKVSRPKEKQTPTKTQSYLLAVDGGTGRRTYVSSLWEGATSSTYKLEYNGVRYIYQEGEGVATIIKADVYV
jgi:hypothetical protein